MKINFTKKQYRLLLDLVYAGELVVNGNRTHDVMEEYEETLNYIYSFAKEFGYEDLIEYEEEYDQYFETKEFEEGGITDLIDEYDEINMFDGMSYELALRDFRKEFEGKPEPTPEVFFAWIAEKQDKYSEEFADNGVDNIIIK